MHGVLALKCGRKRKSGRRHPNGELASKPNDSKKLLAMQPHRAWLPEKHRNSEKAENPLGCLNIIGVVTDEQSEAGRLYAVAVGRYRAVVGTPQGMSGSGRGYDCAPELCQRDQDHDCECESRTNAFSGAYSALSNAGRKAIQVVNRVAVHGQACLRSELGLLCRGLDALASHYDLTGSGKRRNSRY